MLDELVAFVAKTKAQLVVMEATGGMEAPVAAALAAAGVPVAIVNPRQVRDFAKALGKLAKTETIDAGVLAHFAEAIRPAPKPLPEEQTQEIEALVMRRRQLMEMLVAEQCRLRATRPKSMQKNLKLHIDW
jgi:transposase